LPMVNGSASVVQAATTALCRDILISILPILSVGSRTLALLSADAFEVCMYGGNVATPLVCPRCGRGSAKSNEKGPEKHLRPTSRISGNSELEVLVLLCARQNQVEQLLTIVALVVHLLDPRPPDRLRRLLGELRLVLGCELDLLKPRLAERLRPGLDLRLGQSGHLLLVGPGSVLLHQLLVLIRKVVVGLLVHHEAAVDRADLEAARKPVTELIDAVGQQRVVGECRHVEEAAVH